MVAAQSKEAHSFQTRSFPCISRNSLLTFSGSTAVCNKLSFVGSVGAYPVTLDLRIDVKRFRGLKIVGLKTIHLRLGWLDTTYVVSNFSLFFHSEREKWALFQFLEKLYERRKGARAGLGPGSSKGGKGAAQKKVAAKEAFLASARRALRKVAEFEAGASVVPRGINRKWEEKARAPALEDEEPAATPTDAARRGRNSAGGAVPLAVKDDRKARQVAGEPAALELPVVASKGQRTRKKPVNKGKRKTAFGEVLGANGTFGGEKELDLERMREREADILAEAQAAAAAEAAAARAEAEQQAAALNMGPSNFEDMTMDLSALPLPDFAGLGDDAFGGGFDMDFGLGADQFNELAELDKIGLDDLGDMGF